MQICTSETTKSFASPSPSRRARGRRRPRRRQRRSRIERLISGRSVRQRRDISGNVRAGELEDGDGCSDKCDNLVEKRSRAAAERVVTGRRDRPACSLDVAEDSMSMKMNQSFSNFSRADRRHFAPTLGSLRRAQADGLSVGIDTAMARSMQLIKRLSKSMDAEARSTRAEFRRIDETVRDLERSKLRCATLEGAHRGSVASIGDRADALPVQKALELHDRLLRMLDTSTSSDGLARESTLPRRVRCECVHSS